MSYQDPGNRSFESKFRKHCTKKLDGALRKTTRRGSRATGRPSFHRASEGLRARVAHIPLLLLILEGARAASAGQRTCPRTLCYLYVFVEDPERESSRSVLIRTGFPETYPYPSSSHPESNLPPACKHGWSKHGSSIKPSKTE